MGCVSVSKRERERERERALRKTNQHDEILSENSGLISKVYLYVKVFF
jgi:hypothetical protein